MIYKVTIEFEKFQIKLQKGNSFVLVLLMKSNESLNLCRGEGFQGGLVCRCVCVCVSVFSEFN